MSFFKDFKADFAQAVNELIPDSEEMTTEYDDEDMVNTFDAVPEKESKYSSSEDDIEIAPEDLIDDDDIEPESSNDDTSAASEKEAGADAGGDMAQENTNESEDAVSEDNQMQMSFDFLSNAMNVTEASKEDMISSEPEHFDETEKIDDAYYEPETDAVDHQLAEGVSESDVTSADEMLPEHKTTPEDMAMSEETTVPADTEAASDRDDIDTMEQTSDGSILNTEMEEMLKEDTVMIQAEEEKTVSEDSQAEYDDSTTYITKNTKLTGDIETDGSIDIIGEVIGNVTCKGKLVAGGTIKGNVFANEIYANAARIEGDVSCDGSAKVGVGSVVIGKVEAASAVVAGAVNGDIDVHGPVIVDSTAVIMGNIKSRSVQINNGAVIEGFCSQCYSEIDVKSFFA